MYIQYIMYITYIRKNMANYLDIVYYVRYNIHVYSTM